MPKKRVTANISPAIQKLFLGICVFFIVIQVVSQLLFMLQTHATLATTSYLWITIYTVLLPFLLFIAAFSLHPRRAFTLPILFESSFLAAAGFLLYSCLSYIGAFFPSSLVDFTGSQFSWFAYQAALFSTCALIYIGILFVLRRTKHW